MSSLSLQNIKKVYPNTEKKKKAKKGEEEKKSGLLVTDEGVVAVQEFNLEIADKEFIVLVGPSGCGKSTTLRMVAGLEEISGGDLYIDGKRVNDVEPKDRDIAMVFQNYALYPHMTVFENMAFGLKLRKTPKDQIARKVEEAARILDIQHLLDRKPKALSGGQRQRVALGRALVREPQVFLLDEPLSNLDAKLRAQMRTEIALLHKRLGTTFIYVTHDQTEAMTMADRIVVMKDGFIQQVDTPQNLYSYPCNLFVAGFIGSPQMNFIDAKLIKKDGRYNIEFGSEDTKETRGRKFYIELPESKVNEEVLLPYLNKEVIAGVRPECIHDEEMFISSAKTGIIEATVNVAEMMGAETYLYLDCEGIHLTARVSNRSTARPQDVITCALDANRVHLFDKDTEKTILN